MDDMVLFHRNKRELRKIKELVEQFLNKEQLKIKENWQLFKTESRPLDFLGYRFYRGYTTLRRSNFLRMKRRIKRISKKKFINNLDASAVVSYYGWIKHCNNYKFNQKYIKPYVNIKKCKGVIKFASRKQYKTKSKI
jgi:RNA-directed DNA polymerase